MSAHDLFTWREEADAAAAVALAQEAWAQAVQKARYAPHGELQVRRRRMADAATALLAAELHLARVRKVGP